MSDEIEALKEKVAGLEGKRDGLRDAISKHSDLRAELRSVERSLTEAHNELFRLENS